MRDSSKKAVLGVSLMLQQKKRTERLRRESSDLQMTFVDSTGLQVQVKSVCMHTRLDIFKLMLINTEVPWSFKFIDCNRPIYALNEHEILQSYSFIWHLRWIEWSVCLQVDNTSTVYVKRYSEEHAYSLDIQGHLIVAWKHWRVLCYWNRYALRARTTFQCCFAGMWRRSRKPAAFQTATGCSGFVSHTPDNSPMRNCNFSGQITDWGHLVGFSLNIDTTKNFFCERMIY